MAVREIAGKQIEFDEEGFMVDASQWDKEVAAVLAADIGVVPLTDRHWQVIDFCRSDYQALGLNYTVEAATNLNSGSWSTEGVLDAGFGPVDDEIDSVTNRVSTEEFPEQFIRLRIGQQP